MIYTLTNTEIQQCIEFAEKSYTDFYKNRNQYNKDKTIQDNVIGKMAEIAAYQYLIPWFKLSQPDFTIYSSNQKSYSPDMIAEEYNFHVKACRKDSKFPISWLFQKNDPLITRGSDKDILILCVVNGNEVEILEALSVTEINTNGWFKEPKLDRLKATKVCLYFDDLKSNTTLP